MTEFVGSQHPNLVDDPEGDGDSYWAHEPWHYKEGIEDYWTLYQSVFDGAESFLNDLEAEWEQGRVDPSQVLTGRELLREQGYIGEDGEITDEFLDAHQGERLAAESIAAGIGVPDDDDLMVRIEHADLDDETDGRLFIRFAEDVDRVLEVGTLSADDYEYATFAHVDDEDEDVIRTLESDDGDIEILEIYGLDEGESVEYQQFEGNPGDDEIDMDRIEDQQEILDAQEELLEEIADELGGGGGLGIDWPGLPDWEDMTTEQKIMAVAFVAIGLLAIGGD